MEMFIFKTRTLHARNFIKNNSKRKKEEEMERGREHNVIQCA
jgi:hypothetical protein